VQAPARCAQCCCRECGAPQPAVCRRFCVPCLYPSSLRCDHRAASTSTLQAGVFACETFGPMAQLARRVVAAQGCAAVRDITVVAKRSDELSSAPFCLWTQPEVHALLGCWNLEGRVPGSPSGAAPTAGVYAGMHLGGSRAAVVVTEIFDSELLGEGVLPTMRHATAHLLQQVCPSFSCLYGHCSVCLAMRYPGCARCGRAALAGERTARAAAEKRAAQAYGYP